MPARPPKLAQPAQPPGAFAALESRLGYTFADPALLRLALTHRSHTYESVHGPGAADAHQRNTPGTDNEQLEFLGDAVLGLLVTEALLREFPACSEGELTRMRAALVSRARMAEFGRALGLGDHILLGRGVAQSLARGNADNAPTAARAPAALLANAAEAVLAAVYLDASRSAPDASRGTPDASRGGSDPLSALRPLLQQHLLTPDLPGLHAALAQAPHRGALRDSKTLLQELVQAQGGDKPPGKLRYVDLDQTGPPHDRHFTVQVQWVQLPAPQATQLDIAAEAVAAPPEPRLLATGEGRSKKEAQQAAAALALARWSSPASPAAAAPLGPSIQPAAPAGKLP